MSTAPTAPSQGWRSRGWAAGQAPDTPPSPPGWTGRLEAMALVALGVLLAAAVIADVVRQVHLDERVLVDKHTYQRYVSAPTKRIFVDTAARRSKVDVACARPRNRAPERVCLMLGGPTRGPLRRVVGGYRLPLKVPDHHAYRYACSGLAVRHRLCSPVRVAG